MAILAFIGTGNMGSALARAAAKSPRTEALFLSNRSPEKARRLAEELNGVCCANREAAVRADVLFLAVKPQMLAGVAAEIRDVIEARERVLLVSMAAGKDLNTLRELFGDRPTIRIMPNIPVCAGEGLTLFCAGEGVTEEDKALLRELLAPSGLVEELDEKQMDAATGVSGCGPAYAAMFVEALADGAVACGLPRREAQLYAAQMLRGTAAMLVQSGEHPGALKDRVCSPGGSTIQGVRVLEERAFRAAVTDAVIAAFEKKF